MIKSKMCSVLGALLAAGTACGPGAGPEPAPDAAPAAALPPELQRAVDASLDHLDATAARFGLRGRGDLRLATAFTDELSLSHARFQQTLDGVPVFGGEGIVHLGASGAVTSVTDAFVPNPTVRTAPTLSADDAIAIAITTGASGTSSIGSARSALTAPPTSDLWVLRHEGRDRLVWRVQLRILDGTSDTSMPVRFIDAHDGALVWQYDNLQTGTGPSLYSGTITVDTAPNAGQFYLEDLTRKLGTFDMSSGSLTRFEDADDLWDAPAQRAALDAHLGALKTYEYLKTVHGRNGIDGNGGPLSQLAIDGATRLITSRVHYGSSYNNAFWDGTRMTYGDGDGSRFSPLVSLDVAGHEMMHGVTQHTAGLVYSGESGALNESYSDVFGALVERYARGDSEAIWKIGDECFTPAIPGDALRHMDAPHQASDKGYTTDDDPDHYSERYTGGADNGGVHINSGISNKTFYLLAMGGSHHKGGAMTGIGPDKAAAIWFKALTTFMTSSTNFVRAGRATYDAAVLLYGSGSAEAAAVIQAWSLTGIVVDLDPPQVAITAPADGATVEAPMTITASATDNVGVASVQFVVDGTVLATDTSAPFTHAWSTISAGEGPHTVSARALDAAGNTGQSATVTVTVDHEEVPPTVAITAPASGATVGGAVTVTVDATDNAAVAAVALYVDGYALASDSTSPYAFTWSTPGATNGPHQLTVRAIDTVGNTADSAPVSVTVDNDHVPPAVAITAPAPGAEVSGTVAVAIAATDNIGVVRVDLLVDGALAGSDTAPPWEIAWDTLLTGNGPRTLTARAYDALNNSTTSAAVAVTAANPGLATYDAALRAPRCTTANSFCDTGGLVRGRGALGPEPNASNTINGSCADGPSGTFHSAPSLDRLRIFTTDGQPLATGKTVTIEGTVWSWSSTDRLDLFSTVTPSAPVWTLIGTLSLGGTGERVVSTTFTLPAGAHQAIRGQLRYGGAASSPCWSDSYNDRDDLAFAVVDVPDTAPPTAAITAPAAGAEVSSTVTVSATATDNIGVAAVELYVDGALLATDTASPYSFSWNTAITTDGSHTLTVRALDPSGNAGASAPVAVAVANADTTPPVTAITAPSAGATVSGTRTVSTVASDNLGVFAVELYVDGALFATDATSPYSFSWTTTALPNGAHTLQTRARDVAGNVGQSALVSVTVYNADGTGPVSSITSPAHSATVTGAIEVTAAATDNVGVAAVELYVDGALFATDTSEPYTFAWDTTLKPNGSHTLRTRARDTSNNAAYGATITVTVSNADTAPPVTALTAPADGATVSSTRTISASASDGIGSGVVGVDFYLDGALLGTDAASPYNLSWNTKTAPNGPHQLQARARDAAGNVGLSTPITVTVDNPDVTAPSISMTSPTPNATVSGALTVTTLASDNIGVAAVELLVDGGVAATATSAPWSIAWDSRTVSNKAHTLRARARDAAGNVGQSLSITVTVDNGIGTAAYDPALGAPRCAVGYDGCDTATLVNGRGGLGPEPHAPNTLQSSCGDGGSGAYHSSSSIDRLRVFTTDGSALAGGKTVVVEATVWNLWNLLEMDVLDFYYTTSPSSPVWAHIGSVTPGSPQGLRVVSASFSLPYAAPQVAVRVNTRRKPLLGSSAPSPCSAGAYNDRDDLVFAIGGP